MGSGSSNQNRSGSGLFGEGDADPQFTPDMLQALALQGQQQYNQRPARPAPIEHNRTTVRNHFALNKPSLKVSKAQDLDGHYIVTFEFAHTQPCSVCVYYCVEEELDSGGRPVKYDAKVALENATFEGENSSQSYSAELPQNTAVALDSLEFSSSDGYDLVISLNSTSNDSDGRPLSSQTTYVKLGREANSLEYNVKIEKQKIVVDGHENAYDVQEIFGITGNADEEDNECVVCMSAPRNTTVLPCRHMCLCDECAESLRKQTNKCPICRESVQSLLRINVNGNDE